MASFFTGNTGSSTGEHLDFRVYDVNEVNTLTLTIYVVYESR